MGRKQKNLLDETVGLARSLSHAHWFLEKGLPNKFNCTHKEKRSLQLPQLHFTTFSVLTKHAK